MSVKLDDAIDLTKNGKCSDCGGCCSNFLPLRKEEVERLKRFVRRKHFKPIVRCSVLAGRSIDLMCPFKNDEEQRCEVYDIRPEVCRAYRCDQAANGTLQDFKHQKLYTVVNLRQVVFGMENELTVGEYLILMAKTKE